MKSYQPTFHSQITNLTVWPGPRMSYSYSFKSCTFRAHEAAVWKADPSSSYWRGYTQYCSKRKFTAPHAQTVPYWGVDPLRKGTTVLAPKILTPRKHILSLSQSLEALWKAFRPQIPRPGYDCPGDKCICSEDSSQYCFSTIYLPLPSNLCLTTDLLSLQLLHNILTAQIAF